MKQATNNGYAILNDAGDLWTPEWFITKHEALRHISRRAKQHGWNLDNHTVVPAKFTIKWKPDND